MGIEGYGYESNGPGVRVRRFLGVLAMIGASPAKATNLGTLTAITEIGNPGGTKLEVDFIGTGTVVPIPGAAWLFGTGLVALFGCVRRKRAANV